MDNEEDSDEAYLKPAKKKAAINDFFDRVPSKPTARKASGSATAGKPSGSKPAPAKKLASKKKVTSDDDDDDDGMIGYGESPASPARDTAPKRTARAAPKKYIEIPSDEESDDGGKDASMFDDDD